MVRYIVYKQKNYIRRISILFRFNILKGSKGILNIKFPRVIVIIIGI